MGTIRGIEEVRALPGPIGQSLIYYRESGVARQRAAIASSRIFAESLLPPA